MINKIKGILVCTFVIIAAFYVWGDIGMDASPNQTGWVISGGFCGLFSSFVIAVIARSGNPLIVGAAAMTFLYAVLLAILIQGFGFASLNIVHVLEAGALFAGIGVAGGAGYKFASKPAETRS